MKWHFIVLLFHCFAMLLGELIAIDRAWHRVARAHGPQILDAFYIISLPKCQRRIEYFRDRHLGNSSILPEPQIYHAMDFGEEPPAKLPFRVVFNEKIVKPSTLVRAGQVGCFASHHSVWRHALARNANRTLLLEDDVALTALAEARLPTILRDADLGGRWHLIYLRRIPVGRRWRTSWHGTVRRAHPSWGTAAYILSNAGLRFMVAKLGRYEQPLDVVVARLQRTSAEFVALDGCASGPEHRRNCGEMVDEMPQSARGECSRSATQTGWVSRIDAFPCALHFH